MYRASVDAVPGLEPNFSFSDLSRTETSSASTSTGLRGWHRFLMGLREMAFK